MMYWYKRKLRATTLRSKRRKRKKTDPFSERTTPKASSLCLPLTYGCVKTLDCRTKGIASHPVGEETEIRRNHPHTTFISVDSSSICTERGVLLLPGRTLMSTPFQKVDRSLSPHTSANTYGFLRFGGSLPKLSTLQVSFFEQLPPRLRRLRSSYSSGQPLPQRMDPHTISEILDASADLRGSVGPVHVSGLRFHSHR
jgi:hypothetical protein